MNIGRIHEGIILDGVVHEAITEAAGDCTECSLHGPCWGDYFDIDPCSLLHGDKFRKVTGEQ